jgi:hypothetical protein
MTSWIVVEAKAVIVCEEANIEGISVARTLGGGFTISSPEG